jgi:hypothetical protein
MFLARRLPSLAAVCRTHGAAPQGTVTCAGFLASGRRCLSGKAPTKISGEARDTALRQAKENGWELVQNRDAIHRTFLFGNFVESWGFMSQVALISEKMNHHPEWYG